MAVKHGSVMMSQTLHLYAAVITMRTKYVRILGLDKYKNAL